MNWKQGKRWARSQMEFNSKLITELQKLAASGNHDAIKTLQRMKFITSSDWESKAKELRKMYELKKD